MSELRPCNAKVFDRLCSGVNYETERVYYATAANREKGAGISFGVNKKQSAELPAPLTEAIVCNARAELSQGEWGSLEQYIACYVSQRMSAAATQQDSGGAISQACVAGACRARRRGVCRRHRLPICALTRTDGARPGRGGFIR